MPSPSSIYPHDIPADYFDPCQTLYHPPDEATSPDEIETFRKKDVDRKVTSKVL